MIVTKGLGGVVAPHVFAKMSQDEFIDAYQFMANYKNMEPVERKQALIDDYKLIQAENKKAAKTKIEGAE